MSDVRILSTTKPALPSMDSISAAIAVAQSGAFSAAATTLGISHAAITRRVALIEEWAGIKVFKRHSKGIAVTEEGQKILTTMASAISQIEGLASVSKTSGQIPRVRLATHHAFARFYLLPRLSQLEGTPRDLHIELVEGFSHTDLLAGEVDLAIHYGRGAWKKTHATRLLEDALCPVVSSSLEIQAQPHLLHFPLLHAGDSTNWRTWCLTHQIPYRQKTSDRTFDDYSLALEAARHGLGVALWNRRMHDLAPYGKDLVQLNFPVTTGIMAYYLLTTIDRSSAAVETLRERLLNY